MRACVCQRERERPWQEVRGMGAGQEGGGWAGRGRGSKAVLQCPLAPVAILRRGSVSRWPLDDAVFTRMVQKPIAAAAALRLGPIAPIVTPART